MKKINWKYVLHEAGAVVGVIGCSLFMLNVDNLLTLAGF